LWQHRFEFDDGLSEAPEAHVGFGRARSRRDVRRVIAHRIKVEPQRRRILIATVRAPASKRRFRLTSLGVDGSADANDHFSAVDIATDPSLSIGSVIVLTAFTTSSVSECCALGNTLPSRLRSVAA